jgi:FKBP-type peptidyl-prolyl cis-trans isomerase
VITAGNGPKPTAQDVVRVHYKGTLIDGSEFDSSYVRGEPAEFPLDGVIRGWTEGIQLMNTGGKYRLFIPSDLAYGPQGRGPRIPPDSTLVFEVELLDIIHN